MASAAPNCIIERPDSQLGQALLDAASRDLVTAGILGAAERYASCRSLAARDAGVCRQLAVAGLPQEAAACQEMFDRLIFWRDVDSASPLDGLDDRYCAAMARTPSGAARLCRALRRLWRERNEDPCPALAGLLAPSIFRRCPELVQRVTGGRFRPERGEPAVAGFQEAVENSLWLGSAPDCSTVSRSFFPSDALSQNSAAGACSAIFNGDNCSGFLAPIKRLYCRTL